ncbi:hypothetical protein [Streptomyces bathyalis]|nr:hypothetical protein [Streptomyces bathyalis]
MVASRNGMDTDDDGDRSLTLAARFRTEVETLRWEAAGRVRIAHRRVQLWAYIDVALGFPAALLAGVSGAAGLATENARVPAAVLALLAAGFASGAGFLRSSVRIAANKRARHAWAAMESEARILLTRQAQDGEFDSDAAEAALRSLFACRQAALAAYEADGAEI